MCACVLIVFIRDVYNNTVEINIFSLVYFHFGKLQSNTFTERVSKILTDYKMNSTSRPYWLAHKMAANLNVSMRCPNPDSYPLTGK